MALLGVWFDVYRNRTIAGGNAALTTTFAHSLGTTPDLVLPLQRSVERLSFSPSLIGEGANASLATCGVLVQSLANMSVPIVDFDLVIAYVHSTIR